jgi:hypothetical protein
VSKASGVPRIEPHPNPIARRLIQLNGRKGERRPRLDNGNRYAPDVRIDGAPNGLRSTATGFSTTAAHEAAPTGSIGNPQAQVFFIAYTACPRAFPALFLKDPLMLSFPAVPLVVSPIVTNSAAPPRLDVSGTLLAKVLTPCRVGSAKGIGSGSCRTASDVAIS